jgi:hypothetical protein
MKSFALEFFIAARFVNLAVSLPQYQFASHTFQLYDSVLNQFVTGTCSLSLDGLTAMNSPVTTISSKM